MRVSEYFHLAESQPALDFVDIKVDADIPIFIDPRPLRSMPGEWAQEAQFVLQSFFAEVLRALSEGAEDRVGELLAYLSEPSEIHFGFTQKGFGGRGVGAAIGDDLAAALRRSEAATTGLLQDLEDTVLLVPGVGPDLISDITANVIRGPLVEYTQRVAALYGIPIEATYSGVIWNPSTLEWQDSHSDLPIVNDERVLLVPKYLARRRLDYDAGVYYRRYIVPHLAAREIDARSELVRTLKNGKVKVDLARLHAKYPQTAEGIASWTAEFPDALRKYRDLTLRRTRPPLDHAEVAEQTGTPRPDYGALLGSVKAVAPGPDGATLYHRAVRDLLTALLYPAAISPQIEAEIHDGRKRIDLVFENVAISGFLAWLSQHYRAPYLLMECKNYKGDLRNDALDQLSGRFSPRRGQVGFLLCRQFQDKELFLQRCRDTADDGRGFILVLDDGDLESLVDAAVASHGIATPEVLAYPVLREQFNQLVM